MADEMMMTTGGGMTERNETGGNETKTADMTVSLMNRLYTLFSKNTVNYTHDCEGDDLSVCLALKKYNIKHNSILVPTTKDTSVVMERKLSLAYSLDIQRPVEEAEDTTVLMVTAPVDLSNFIHIIVSEPHRHFTIIEYSGTFNLKENHKWLPELLGLDNVTIIDLSMFTATKEVMLPRLKNTFALTDGTDFLERLSEKKYGAKYREFTAEFNKENIKPYSEDKNGVRTGSLYEDLNFLEVDPEGDRNIINTLQNLYKDDFMTYLEFNRGNTNYTFSEMLASTIRQKIKQKKRSSVKNLDVDLPYADNVLALLISKVMTNNYKGLKFVRCTYDITSSISKDNETSYFLTPKENDNGNCYSFRFTQDFCEDEATNLYRELWL